MLARLSFKAKLLTLCAFLVAVSLIVGGVGYLGQSQASAEYEHVTHVSVPKTELVYQMLQHYRQIRISLRTLGLQGITPAQAETAVRETVDSIGKYEEVNKKYVELGFSPGQQEVYDKLQAGWVDFKAVGARVLELHKSGKADDHAKILDIFFHDCPEKAEAYNGLGEALLKYHKESEDAWILKAQATAQRTNILSLLAILIGSATGLGVGIYFAASVSNRLSQIIARLSADSHTLAIASDQICASSQELSGAATEQAASLEETAASVEEMNSMVSKTSENAKNTSATSAASEQKALEGKQVIEQMLTSMTEINQSNEAIMAQINQSNQQMGEIVNVIQGIGEKTKVINDIVFQTKLLSFNASVEAARAGEHGKGFAVVAEEVGNLAAMSGNAAKEITGMLDSSMQKVKSIVTETQEKVGHLAATGKAKVESGSGVVRQCASVFEEIVKNVGGVSVMSNEIAQAAQEQARGIQEITKAMSQLDQVTQQNSAASQQTASAAGQVSAQAASLKSAVEELTLTFRGAGTPALASAPAPSAQVISLAPRPVAAPKPQRKRAVGDGTVPNQNHPSFEEV